MALTNRQFTALMRQSAKAAVLHNVLNAKLTDAFRERYGVTYSEVDCDTLIDALDYGHGPADLKSITAKGADRAMLECGVRRITE